jgi:hypothetical protein
MKSCTRMLRLGKSKLTKDPVDIRTGNEESKGTVLADGNGTGETLIKDPPPDPPAIFKAASRDPRFARDSNPTIRPTCCNAD